MAILLVPGFMADESLWRDLAPSLARFAPVVHADLRHDTTIDAMARRALAAAPPRFFLVGFSMGGYVAREIARLAPERVAALVLIATSTRPDTASLHPKERHNEALIERVRAMGVRLGGEAFRRQSMLERPSDLDRLAGIRCPTLVVAAAHDQLRSIDESRELQQGIPGAELAVIEDSGHMIPIEAPQRLIEVMVPWLERHVDP